VGTYKYSAEEDIKASKKEVTEEWRKVHNKGLRGMHSSRNSHTIISSMRWERHVACIDEKRNAHRVLVVSAERKKPSG